MKKSAYIVLAYAFIVFSGGIMGGFIAHSVPSLVAGIAFGSLIAFNGFKMLKGNVKGLTLALIQSIILGSFFVYRYKTTGSFMPAGIMIIISFAVSGFLLMVHPKEAPEQK